MCKWLAGVIFGLALSAQASASGDSIVFNKQVHSEGVSKEASLSVAYSEDLKPLDVVMHGDLDWTLGGVEGNATVEFDLNADGKPINAVVVESSSKQMAEISLNAVEGSIYQAAGAQSRHRVTYTSTLELNNANHGER